MEVGATLAKLDGDGAMDDADAEIVVDRSDAESVAVTGVCVETETSDAVAVTICEGV